MITHLTLADDVLLVHLEKLSLKATKGFTHGSILIDQGGVTFAKFPPVALPAGFVPAIGMKVSMQLMAPDGSPRKQTRTAILLEVPKEPGKYRAAGQSKTPRKFSAEDGWRYEIYKYRAYFTHPGLKTDAELPEWLKASITRQRDFWNRLAYLCCEARRKCSPVPSEEVKAFVWETILPAIDHLNDSLGRSKQKMKHPDKLKGDEPAIDGLWRFVGEMRKRADVDRPVPEGLLEKTIAFAEQFKVDYTPLNDFLNNFNSIAKKAAEEFGLRHWEVKPLVSGFKAVLDRRKKKKSGFMDDWPLIKYADSPKAENWGIHFSCNKAGIDSADLETGDGIPGLSFGPPFAATDTDHAQMVGSRTMRKLREAEIYIGADEGERFSFQFGVLQHRPLPAGSHLKGWKLIYQGGALWLCLTVELQRPLAEAGELAAGLDVGWRRTETGIRFGTLYEPAKKTIRELTVDLQRSPNDHAARVPFRLDLGPTRWEKRNLSRLLPDWKPGDPLPSAFETRGALQTRRDYQKDATKALFRKHLGEKTPAWFDKAGRKGLRHLAEEFKDDPVACEILTKWRAEDEQIGTLVSMYLDRTTKRIEYGHAQIAHDVCRHLQQCGISRLIVQSSFLAKLAQNQDNEDPVSLKRSQKYRQFVAVGKFVSVLKNTAAKYGIVVDALEAVNPTRICQHCNTLNAGTEKERLNCSGCGRTVDQDQNAAVNLSRFGSNPELAAMATVA
jgi:hypothetical protein